MQHRLELNYCPHSIKKPVLEEYLRQLCSRYGATFTLEDKTLRVLTTSEQLPKMLANGYIALYDNMCDDHLRRLPEEYLPVLYSRSVVRLANGDVVLVLPPGGIGAAINDLFV